MRTCEEDLEKKSSLRIGSPRSSFSGEYLKSKSPASAGASTIKLSYIDSSFSKERKDVFFYPVPILKRLAFVFFARSSNMAL